MPDEIIQIEDQYYILAASTRTDDQPRVIKQGESFGVFDHSGAIRPVGLGEQGLYHEGTRHLSRFELVVQNRRLQPLRSTVRSDHVLVVDLANPDYLELLEPVSRAQVHVQVTSFLHDGAWHARIALHSYAMRPLELDVGIRYGADFVDLFELRGMKRERRGRLLDPIAEPGGVALGYEGLDGVTRLTRLAFAPAPSALTSALASFAVRLAPESVEAIDVCATFELSGRRTVVAGGFAEAMRHHEELETRLARTAKIELDNHRVYDWVDRAACDVRMMITETPHGPYPYAGVPWFSTVFGRDGLITAAQLLWIDPSLARGVLAHLAALQADALDDARDAEPGKIIHETRLGEMAALGEVPFAAYYGSIDATPLFVALAGGYWRRTADLAFIEALWPNIERALAWIDHWGDRDGDGFVEYARRSPKGLVVQGWKDSADSVFHADGALAEGPVTLCEVQAYVYAARRGAAAMARALGRDERARDLEQQADALAERFDAAFWSEELGTYYLALDGDKRPCAVRTSNAGHCLFGGIAKPQRAGRVVEALLAPSTFTGWGIRTVDAREVRYNPMSYHNGSIWPHDNAMAAIGMARYGYKREAVSVLLAMYRAGVYFDLQRMPELFCGFPRLEHDGPVPYPVACSPQAWASGAVFMLLQACLGIDVDATQRRIRFVLPALPDNVSHLAIRDLRVLDASLDLVVARHAGHVGVQVERCDGNIEVSAVKR
ncbi:MAG: amylo-alpha-1,6-glucosidase [Deltaproteobacteria bacterium]|nr:amylo-alpha-1,6-glucosidase [Deltaproteobacteria bacterium]MCW5803904.1 amylo-alpha-1,6-glucosidase [Deltaproteobacteria bacterium]